MSGEPDVHCQVVNHGTPHRARWSICNLEGHDMQPIVRGLACGRHLHLVLDSMQWHMDCVHVYDLSIGEQRS